MLEESWNVSDWQRDHSAVIRFLVLYKVMIMGRALKGVYKGCFLCCGFLGCDDKYSQMHRA